MPHQLRELLTELNWPLFIINIILAVCTGISIAYGLNATTWQEYGSAIGICCLKDVVAFFSNAKKVFEKE